MHKVTISKSGLFFSFWDDSTENWIQKSLADSTLPITWFMNYAVEIEEGLTVRSVLNLLKPYSEAVQFYFIQSLAGIDLAEIFMLSDQATINAAKIDATQVFLLKIADVGKITEAEEVFNFFEVQTVLMGLEIIDEDNSELDVLHPLASINFQDWCDLPLIADDWLEFIDPKTETVYFEGLTNWTFAEVISTILSQAAITLQITQTVSDDYLTSPVKDGPVEISHIWDWLDDLDFVYFSK